MIQFVWFLQDEQVNGKSLLAHLQDKKLVTAEQAAGLGKGHYPPKGELGADGLITLMNMPQSLIESLRVEDWDRMIDVNIKGVLYGIAAALPYMTPFCCTNCWNVSPTGSRQWS